MLEKGADVGGTWRDNTYPGATCDIPSQLYSYSFAELRLAELLLPAAGDPGLHQAGRRRVRARSTGSSSTPSSRTPPGTTRRSAGRCGPGRHLVSQTLIVGAGGLSAPKLPEIEGIDTFQGEVFHSARWDHDVDLTGKRVAVIGTGASAIQIVPELQKTLQATGGHLDVYQRTAPWIIPRNDRPYGKLERAALRRVPGLQRLYRTGLYWAHEAYVPAFTLAAQARRTGAEGRPQEHPARASRTPSCARRSRRTSTFGCKRVLRSNDYYPALDADNTELVTDPIAKVTGNAIVTADGVEREIDVLVVATGFYTTELPITEHVTGRTGQTLAERWRATGMAAYKGTTIPEFPNLFMLVGPEHRPGPHQHDLHHRVAGRLPARRAAHACANRRLASVEPTQADTDALEPQPAEADGPHRVDHRRLPELVPRRPRPQHHAVAPVHRRLPAPAGVVRRRCLPRRPAPMKATQ